ncbi:MAG TPA: M56 family metallopeptidase [Tepidisphaeraceae bacterium]|jgi:beta-lactamase regulating signal transducer with metallopeptidase domain
MLQLIDNAFHWTLAGTLPAAVLVATVLILRLFLHKTLAPKWWCALWLLAGLRFVMPPIYSVTFPASNATPQITTTVAPVEQPTSGLITRITLAPLGETASTPRPRLAEPAQRRVSPRHLALVWFAVASLFLIRRALSLVTLWLHLLKLPAVEDPFILQITRNCAAELRLRRRIRILQTTTIRTPAVAGIFRPALLLPQDTAGSTSPEELRLIVLHELLHIKRQDVLIERLIRIVRDLHWFNPIAWLWSRCYALDRELACDHAVLQRMRDADRNSYAHCLLTMVQRLSSLPALPATVGMFHPKANLKRRLTMISTFGNPRPRVASTLFGLLATLAVGCAALTGQSRADSTPATRPAPAASVEPPAQPGPAHPRATAIDQSSNEPVEAPAEEHVAVQDRALAAALDRKLPKLEFNTTPFEQVINTLRDQTGGTNIYVNWRALEAAGIERIAPVTARLRDVKFRKALEVVLADVGGGNVKLGFTPSDGVITISTAEDIGKNTITRVYDIRDLLVDPKDYTAAGEKQSLFTRSREQRVEDITKLIQETVAPDTWREAGGTLGSLRELSGQLIVTQTPENHQQIHAVLESMRDSRSLQVVINARFITANLRSLSADLRAVLDPALGDKNTLILSAQRAEDLVRQIVAQRDSQMVAAPRLTAFSGQRAFVSVGSQTSYVSGYSAVKQQNGDLRFDPQSSTVTAGVTVDVTPTAAADRKSITLVVKPKLTTLLGMSSEQWSGADVKDLRVQNPILGVQEASTTASVPNDQVLVLATTPASTLASNRAATQPAKAMDPDERLFVLVKPTLILQREAPATNPRRPQGAR